MFTYVIVIEFYAYVITSPGLLFPPFFWERVGGFCLFVFSANCRKGCHNLNICIVSRINVFVNFPYGIDPLFRVFMKFIDAHALLV